MVFKHWLNSSFLKYFFRLFCSGFTSNCIHYIFLPPSPILWVDPGENLQLERVWMKDIWGHFQRETPKDTKVFLFKQFKGNVELEQKIPKIIISLQIFIIHIIQIVTFNADQKIIDISSNSLIIVINILITNLAGKCHMISGKRSINIFIYTWTN